MIELSNRAYYTGITNDVHNRMKIHSAGKGSKYVRAHLPLRLIYLEEVGGRGVTMKSKIFPAIDRMSNIWNLVINV